MNWRIAPVRPLACVIVVRIVASPQGLGLEIDFLLETAVFGVQCIFQIAI
jgi:hypothetical protein